MKAKIVPKKEIVLLYRHEQAKNAQALLLLLERLQFDYRLVEDGELGLTMGQLAGRCGASRRRRRLWRWADWLASVWTSCSTKWSRRESSCR